MIVDTLKVTVGFVVDLFAKVLVCFRPHLRKIGLKKKGIGGRTLSSLFQFSTCTAGREFFLNLSKALCIEAID